MLGISALIAGGLAIALAVFLVVVLLGPLVFWLAWNVLDFAGAVGLPELGFWGIVLATLFLVVGFGGKVLIAGIVFLVDPDVVPRLGRGALARADVPQLRRGRPALRCSPPGPMRAPTSACTTDAACRSRTASRRSAT